MLALPLPPRPPLVGLVLAVILHAVLLMSVRITAATSSGSVETRPRAASMVVRTIDEVPAAAASPIAEPGYLPSLSEPDASPRSPRLAEPGLALPQHEFAFINPPTPVIAAEKYATRSTAQTLVQSAAEIATEKPLLAASTIPRASPGASDVSPASSSAAQLPVAPQYRAAGALDPGPKPLGDINPDYPTRAGQQQGIVVLRLLINEQGVVDNVAVVRATPAGFFEESALQAFGTALFSPGKVLGVAVKSQITIEVEFMPINRGATVSGRTY